MFDDSDARIFSGVFFAEGPGVIIGAIVDNDNFKVVVRLVENRIYATRQSFFGVVSWDNNREFNSGVLIEPSIAFSHGLGGKMGFLDERNGVRVKMFEISMEF